MCSIPTRRVKSGWIRGRARATGNGSSRRGRHESYVQLHAIRRRGEMKLTVGKKLGLCFGSILGLMAVSTFLSYLRVSEVQQIQATVLTVRVPSLDAVRQMQRDIFQTGSKCRQAILAGSENARKADAMQRFDGIWSKVEQDAATLSDLSPKWTRQENRDRLASIKQRLPEIQQAQRHTI